MKMRFLPVAFALITGAVFAANVTGTWKAEFDTQIGVQKYTYTLKQDGATVTGKASSDIGGEKRETELKEGKLDGDKISFVELFKFQDNEIRITYTGKLSDNEIKFTREVGEFAKEAFVAKREVPPAPPASQPGLAHAYLKVKKAPHIRHDDSDAHALAVWRTGGDHFAQRIVR